MLFTPFSFKGYNHAIDKNIRVAEEFYSGITEVTACNAVEKYCKNKMCKRVKYGNGAEEIQTRFYMHISCFLWKDNSCFAII